MMAFFLFTLVMLIPAIGLIMSIVWSIMKGSQSRRRLAGAMIIINVIIMGLAAAFVILSMPILDEIFPVLQEAGYSMTIAGIQIF